MKSNQGRSGDLSSLLVPRLWCRSRKETFAFALEDVWRAENLVSQDPYLSVIAADEAGRLGSRSGGGNSEVGLVPLKAAETNPEDLLLCERELRCVLLLCVC